MLARCTTILLLSIFCLCGTNALAQSDEKEQTTEHSRIFIFQMENDRLDGSDDGHTHSFRFFLQWPKRRPDISLSINYESLTQRYEDARVDLLGINLTFGSSVWRGGRLAFSGGVAVNGDLGGESLQNALHELLNESTLNLAYPDGYAFGLTAGTHIDQKIVDIGGFSLSGSGDVGVASNAAPSLIQGGIFVGRQFLIWANISLNVQFGMSVNNYFRLSNILEPYYGRGSSLDSHIRLEWKRLSINSFYYSDPYGVDQGILGVGFGCYF